MLLLEAKGSRVQTNELSHSKTGAYNTAPESPSTTPCSRMRCQTLVAQLDASIARQLTTAEPHRMGLTQSGYRRKTVMTSIGTMNMTARRTVAIAERAAREDCCQGS
jgi:hypothetical protein